MSRGPTVRSSWARRAVQTLAGLAVSALALWYTLRGKDLGAVWRALLAGDYRWLVPYVAAGLAIHVVRTVRWGLLLEPVAHVPFWRLNAASAVGSMALLILPLRLGEFARPYLVADRPRLRVSAALSSIVVERVLDSLSIAVILVVALMGVPDGTPGVRMLRAAGAVVFVGFALLLGVLVAARRNRAHAVLAAQRMVGIASRRLAARVSGMVGAFLDGLAGVSSSGKAGAFLALTALQWALNAVSIMVLARGLGLALSPVAACTVLGVLVIGIMIPAGPASVGTFQAAVLLGLSVFTPRAVLDTRGVALANLYWGGQFALQTGVGLVFLFSRHVRLERILDAAAEVEEELEEEAAGKDAA